MPRPIIGYVTAVDYNTQGDMVGIDIDTNGDQMTDTSLNHKRISAQDEADVEEALYNDCEVTITYRTNTITSVTNDCL